MSLMFRLNGSLFFLMNVEWNFIKVVHISNKHELFMYWHNFQMKCMHSVVQDEKESFSQHDTKRQRPKFTHTYAIVIDVVFQSLLLLLLLLLPIESLTWLWLESWRSWRHFKVCRNPGVLGQSYGWDCIVKARMCVYMYLCTYRMLWNIRFHVFPSESFSLVRGFRILWCTSCAQAAGTLYNSSSCWYLSLWHFIQGILHW